MLIMPVVKASVFTIFAFVNIFLNLELLESLVRKSYYIVTLLNWARRNEEKAKKQNYLERRETNVSINLRLFIRAFFQHWNGDTNNMMSFRWFFCFFGFQKEYLALVYSNKNVEKFIFKTNNLLDKYFEQWQRLQITLFSLLGFYAKTAKSKKF